MEKPMGHIVEAETFHCRGVYKSTKALSPIMSECVFMYVFVKNSV